MQGTEKFKATFTFDYHNNFQDDLHNCCCFPLVHLCFLLKCIFHFLACIRSMIRLSSRFCLRMRTWFSESCLFGCSHAYKTCDFAIWLVKGTTQDYVHFCSSASAPLFNVCLFLNFILLHIPMRTLMGIKNLKVVDWFPLTSTKFWGMCMCLQICYEI